MSSPSPIVCVIDDDPSVRHSLVALLQCFDFDVRAFRSAEDCLAADLMHNAVFLVVDYRLPGMTGIQLLDHLRKAGWNHAAALISGNADIHQLESSGVLERVYFLTKPSDPTRLIKIISTEVASQGENPTAL